MRTGDGFEVEWPYSRREVTTVFRAHLDRLRGKDALDKALAHAELTRAQLAYLYDFRGYPYAFKLAFVGRKVRAFDLHAFAEGLSLHKLYRALGRGKQDRKALIEALLREDR